MLYDVEIFQKTSLNFAFTIDFPADMCYNSVTFSVQVPIRRGTYSAKKQALQAGFSEPAFSFPTVSDTSGHKKITATQSVCSDFLYSEIRRSYFPVLFAREFHNEVFSRSVTVGILARSCSDETECRLDVRGTVIYTYSIGIIRIIHHLYLRFNRAINRKYRFTVKSLHIRRTVSTLFLSEFRNHFPCFFFFR